MVRHNRTTDKSPSHGYVAFRFTSNDMGKIFIFQNPYDQKNYSFELLDSVSVPLAELDESKQIIENMHYKPNVAVEQLWCRIKPSINTDLFAIGYDEVLGDLFETEEDVLNGFQAMAVGIQLDSKKDYGKDVYICSAIKPDRDFEIKWKLELFAPEKEGRKYA